MGWWCRPLRGRVGHYHRAGAGVQLARSSELRWGRCDEAGLAAPLSGSQSDPGRLLVRRRLACPLGCCRRRGCRRTGHHGGSADEGAFPTRYLLGAEAASDAVRRRGWPTRSTADHSREPTTTASSLPSPRHHPRRRRSPYRWAEDLRPHRGPRRLTPGRRSSVPDRQRDPHPRCSTSPSRCCSPGSPPPGGRSDGAPTDFRATDRAVPARDHPDPPSAHEPRARRGLTELTRGDAGPHAPRSLATNEAGDEGRVLLWFLEVGEVS